VCDVLRSPLARGLVVVALLAGLVGLGVWYGSLPPDPAVGDYPRSDHLAGEYDAHVGERVEVAGTVVATDPVVVETTSPGGTLRLRVTGLDRRVREGDALWVYAVVEPDRTVRVVDAVVVAPWRVDYMRGVSLLAGLWVLGRLLRDWRVDTSAWGLAPDDRGRWPAAAVAAVRRRLSATGEGGEGDA
jgi:hypothetical protein